jgi:hypothetical protein
MTLTKGIAATSPAFFAAATALLEAYESTPWAAGCALLGAWLAWLEATGRHWATRCTIMTFNAVVGVIGGPIVAIAIHTKAGIQHPGILILASLVLGYLAHGALDSLKHALAARVARIVRGTK